VSVAVDLGIADHGERAGREQAAQIAIALFLLILPLHRRRHSSPSQRRETEVA
jgi:hypothetical protein